MKKQKVYYENVVIPKEVIQNPLEKAFLNSSVELNFNFGKKVSDILSKKVAVYFSLGFISLALIFLINWLFLFSLFASVLLGVRCLWEDYKFYLIKKDFEEEGIF